MGDQPADGDKSQPSLELPSLFGRRKRSRRASRDARPGPETADVEDGPTTTRQSPVLDDSPERPASAVDQHLPGAEPEVPGAAVHEASWVEPQVTDLEPTESYPEPTEADLEPETAPAGGARRAARRARRNRPRRTLPGHLAAVLTGVLVGLFGALLTWGSLLGCDAVRGTKSCGGPGLFLLLAIVVLMVLLGAALLRLFRVPEPRSTSFLAVGLTAVVVLVALMEELFSTWMFVAVPLISAAAYSLAHWVTTRYVESTERGPEHDVR